MMVLDLSWRPLGSKSRFCSGSGDLGAHFGRGSGPVGHDLEPGHLFQAVTSLVGWLQARTMGQEGDFEAYDTFQGARLAREPTNQVARPGYAFKTGIKGTGCRRDHAFMPLNSSKESYQDLLPKQKRRRILRFCGRYYFDRHQIQTYWDQALLFSCHSHL